MVDKQPYQQPMDELEKVIRSFVKDTEAIKQNTASAADGGGGGASTTPLAPQPSTPTTQTQTPEPAVVAKEGGEDLVPLIY